MFQQQPELRQQRSSTDQKWLTYLLLVFTYTLAVVSDLFSALMFFMVLLQFVGFVRKAWLYFIVQLILIADFLIKSPYLQQWTGIPTPTTDPAILNPTLVQQLLHHPPTPKPILYLTLQAYNLFLCLHTLYKYLKYRQQSAVAGARGRPRTYRKTWGPLMTQIMVYTLPIVLYGFSLVSRNLGIKIGWALLAAFQLLDVVGGVKLLGCCGLVVVYYFFGGDGTVSELSIYPQYVIQYNNITLISQTTTNRILHPCFIFLLVLLNVYSNPHPDYTQQSTPPAPDMKQSARKLARRVIREQSSKQKTKAIITLALAIVLCLITTSIGNVFIVVGLYFSLPDFKCRRFFAVLGFGVVVSMGFQPEQVAYFIYLYTVILIVGQKITSNNVVQFEMHSYSFLLNIYRLYIMLSHISFLNWAISIFHKPIIVTVALCIRIVCRYIGYVSVFLGTNDNYGFDNSYVDLGAGTDIVLIIYLVMLKLYSPQKTKTYPSSTLTNILLQYPILSKLPFLLKPFRIFNWLSYITFSLLILTRRPSLYITLHIFFLVLILLTDTIKSPNLPKTWLNRLFWTLCFYCTVVMVFVKYFYFLKMYDSNSEVMDSLIGVLERYRLVIGLDQFRGQYEGVRLVGFFWYDWAVMFLAWVNIYIYDFKLQYEARQKQVQDRNTQQIDTQIAQTLKDLLQQLQTQSLQPQPRYSQKSNQYLQTQKKQQQLLKKKQSYEQELEKAKHSNIDYFYHKYVKPVDLTRYLATHEYRIMEKIIRDCLLDFCFGIVVLAFYLEKREHVVEFVLYLPHFFISGFGFYWRFRGRGGLEFIRKVLSYSTAWSFIMLFGSYVYITILQMYNKELPSALVQVYVTYILCIVICVLYKFSCAVPDRKPDEKDYHCLIYMFFPFAVQSNKLWTQMLSIFSQFWLTLTMSLFFTNIFSPKLVSTFIHPFIALYLLLVKISKQKSQQWLYIICLVSIFDIWNYDFFAYTTVLSTTIFYAIKTGQKMSQQNQSTGFKEGKPAISVVQASQIESQIDAELDQGNTLYKIDSEEKKWHYYIAYCTMVWMLPQFLFLLWMFGVVWLSPSIVATVLIAFSYVALVYQLLIQKYTQISRPLMTAALFITCLFFIYELVYYILAFFYPNKYQYNNSAVGLFLIFQSCFFYLTLKKRVVWFTKRTNDAKAYWNEKTELIGQLGSQLHNEKKLITLQRYYSSKQRLTQKVNKISQHLKNDGRKAYFQSLDSIFKTHSIQQGTYQLYTNMLIFLDIGIVKKCFLMLNQYITANKSQNIVEKAKTLRQQIFRTYYRSFNEAFSRYNNQVQNHEQNLAQEGLHQSPRLSRSSTVNLQKINEINQRYKKCFELITNNTERFNRFFRLVMQNFEIISMMIVVGWNLFGGVYTIPVNIIIFGWAVVLENKTTVTFWIIVMSYVCFILLLKQVLTYIPDNSFTEFVFYYHSEDYLYEFFIVLVSAIQITLIKLGGTRYKAYSQRESIYDAFYRAALNKAANGSQLDKQQDFMEIYKNLVEPERHSFFYRVFSKSRFKPGKDFYPLMSAIQLFILLYIFFFYDMMEFQSKKNRKSIGELLTVNQFSSHMIKGLFMQVVVMVIDRLIISLNLVDQDNQALQNFFLSFTFSLTEVKQPPPQKLDKVGIFDFLLVLKYLFHLTLLIFINFFIYFYIPSAGLTKSLIPSCSESQCNKSYSYLSIFLILYFCYFLVSGLQIKHGFNRNKCKNVLMQKYHYTNYYIYKVFTAIPFAWQFKKICDWTVTSTALPLFHWMKFQDINARLYQSKCQAQMIKLKPLGTPWNKYMLGPSGFIIILLLAFSPFIIYSSVNPFAVRDIVVGAKMVLYLNMDDRYDYKFFSTSHATVTEIVSNDFKIRLTDQDLFLIKLSKYPDENFLLSQPVIQQLAARIKSSISDKMHRFSFVMKLNVIQQQGGQNMIQWSKKQLNHTQLQNLYKFLTLNRTYLVIQKFYSPFPGQITAQPILIKTTVGQYFQVSIPRKIAPTPTPTPTFQQNQTYFYYLTSNKYKTTLGILTFYVTYILVLSRLLRFYLTGTIRNVFYSGCYLESILVLCEAVREARIVENFVQEESFYFELVDIMRHPKAIKAITGDFVGFRKKYI